MNAEALRASLHYDSETGVFTRKVAASHARVGDVAGTVHKKRGYVEFWVLGELVKAHRVAVLWMTGAPPLGQVDHINGDRSDNRWSNLRVVDNKTNSENRTRANKNNQTGLLGVKWHASKGKFESRIRCDGKLKYLGIFETAQQAHDAYLSAKRSHHTGCTI